MKINKIINVLVAIMLVAQGVAFADAPVNTNGAGIYNPMNRQQIKQYDVQKQITQPIDSKDDSIDEAFYMNVQKDYEKDGVIYNPQFKVNEIIFEGNTKVKTASLNTLAESVIGQDIYFEDLLRVAKKITKYYQAKGFLTSYAFIPSQNIKNGVVTICIVESKVDSIDIEGNRWARSWYLKNIIMGKNGLREGDVFNAGALQGALREINQEDYIEAQSFVSKNDDKTQLKLDVKDRFPLKFDFAWDDYGRSYTGVQRASFLLGLDNVTGMGDKIYGGTILSSGATGVLAGYSVPISPYGTRLSFDFSNSNINLGGPYKFLNVKGKAQSYALRITHPLIENAKTSVVAYTGIDFVNASTESKLLNSTLSDYNLYVLRSGFHGMTDDKNGRWIGTLGFDVGLPGATKGEIRGPQGVFFKLVAGATRVQRLFGRTIGILRVNGQYSPNRLYTAEQMQIGGPYTLRGYQPAELIGDYGVTGTAEIRTPIPGLRKILPNKLKFIDDKVRLAVFYDFGWVQEHSHLYDYPQNFLHSVGFGSYISLTDWISLQFGVGIPLGRKYYGENSARFYFGLNSELDNLIPKKRTEKL